ncbi:hypothetical protein CEK69_00010 [Xanthomonas sp. LMG 12462]|nr:hypothetical protein CEK69_00010 [Xanthomonas sp. LMG 12462]
MSAAASQAGMPICSAAAGSAARTAAKQAGNACAGAHRCIAAVCATADDTSTLPHSSILSDCKIKRLRTAVLPKMPQHTPDP